jgi:DNA topoisomerase-1
VTTARRFGNPAPQSALAAPAAASAAGLQYVSDTMPGFTRVRSGKGFRHLDTEGRPCARSDVLARIRKLAIPPAWRDVWICALPNGHLQATGRDSKGRKQYRYHAHWREVRDETKYERMIDFARVLPALRARTEATWRVPVCRARRWWRPWCGCSRHADPSRQRGIRAPQPLPSASPRCATRTSE